MHVIHDDMRLIHAKKKPHEQNLYLCAQCDLIVPENRIKWDADDRPSHTARVIRR